MSPRKLHLTYIQAGFRDDQIKFLDTEAERRAVPRVQVIRDAVEYYRLFLQNGSTDKTIQPAEGK